MTARNRIGVIVVVALALGAGALLLRRPTWEAIDAEGGARRGPEGHPPPPAESGLAARPPSSSASPGAGASTAPATGAELVVDLRYPRLPRGEKVVSLRFHMAPDRAARLEWAFGSPDEPLPSSGPLPLRGARLDASAEAERMRVTGLEAVLTTVVAQASVGGHVVAASAPLPLELRPGENQATLDLVDAATLVFSVTDDGAAVDDARIRVQLGELPWATVQTDLDGRATVSAPAAAVRTWLEGFPGIEPGAGPWERSFRLAPGERREVSFEVPPTVPVRFRAIGPHGGDVYGGGISGIWEIGRGGRPRYVGLIQRAGPDGERWYRLAPGRYGVRYVGAGDLAPAWHEFTVVPGEPTTVRVPLASVGRRVRIRLRGPDGGPPVDRAVPPRPIASVILGRQGYEHPSEAAGGTVALDGEGRGESHPLPDGDYDVAVPALRLHRRVALGAGSTDFELRLPAPPDAAKTGGLAGKTALAGPEPGQRVRTWLVGTETLDVAPRLRAWPSAGEWGRSPDRVGADFYAFDALPEGNVLLRVDPGPYAPLSFRPYEARVRIAADAVTTHDVRVEAR